MILYYIICAEADDKRAFIPSKNVGATCVSMTAIRYFVCQDHQGESCWESLRRENVPSQIADKLRGREFANFDAFRKAFWQEVSKDPALSKQFIVSNRSRMAVGKAPKARKLDAAGKRTSF